MKNWATKPIADVILKTPTTDPKKTPDLKFLYVDVSGVSNKTLKVTAAEELLGKDAPSRARRIVSAGDVIFATVRPTLRRIAIVPDYLDGQVVSTGYFVFKPNSEVSNRYLYYYLQTETFMGNMQRLQAGASYPAVNDTQVKSQTISYPPIPEQQRIVAILDQAFADIEKARANAEQNLKNARELFDSYLNQVFSQRGEGWVDRTLGEISDRVSVGHVGPTTEFYCDANIGVPFIRSQNVKPYGTEITRIKYITQEFHNSLKKSQLQSGDLLFVRVGANRGDCCALREFQGELNCANIVFARPRGPSIDFLEYFCNSPIGQRCLLGMTTGSAQGVINTKSVAQLEIPLPPREQQLKVVDSISRLRVQAEQLEGIYINKINSLDELKKSLLQKAFSGELTKTEGMVA